MYMHKHMNSEFCRIKETCTYMCIYSLQIQEGFSALTLFLCLSVCPWIVKILFFEKENHGTEYAISWRWLMILFPCLKCVPRYCWKIRFCPKYIKLDRAVLSERYSKSSCLEVMGTFFILFNVGMHQSKWCTVC